MNPALVTIDTPVYTEICWIVQNISGSLCKWDIASHTPPDKIITGPITARIDAKETRLFGFTSEEFDNFWISLTFCLSLVGI
jgi:hypothetical protein